MRNSSQYVDHVMPLCLSLMHALAGSVDPSNLEINYLSFLNQTLLQIEKYMKNE